MAMRPNECAPTGNEPNGKRAQRGIKPIGVRGYCIRPNG